MGRPEPFVLFAQTFVHPQLDEYVDEVIFAEPVVIAACEFLEQNGPSASSAVTLLGATSPPSFALEVFVQCEGETRFRRLCQPFLYSHSASNVLEVEAVVTNHLVVRGSYRSLSLVIYGNTAEDLGQFSLEFDLDSSLTNLVSSTETRLDDLLPLLNERNQKVEDSTLSLKALQPLLPVSDVSTEIRRFMQLVFRILDVPELGDFVHKVISTVCSVAASSFTHDLLSTGVNMQRFKRVSNDEKAHHIIIEASQGLLDRFKEYSDAGSVSAEILDSSFLEFDSDLATSKELVDALFQHFQFKGNHPYIMPFQLSQGTAMVMWLSSVLLLCSGKEGCFHFVNGGGMEQVTCVLGNEMHSSSACTLALLAVIEQATRFSVGCEGFLGWWPRDGLVVPSGVSEGYSHLLRLLMHKQRHDFASLATYILNRLRLYEVVSRYECAVLSVMRELSGVKKITKLPSNVFINLRSQLKKILKMINSSTLVEDPSPVACATRSLLLVQNEGLLSFKATSKLIASSSCCFLNCDMDPNLLSLFKERGLFPLSIALMSSPKLREQVGHSIDVFADIVSSIEATTLLLLFSRSGLVFLLHNPELSSLIRCALNEAEVLNKDECIPLRYGYTLISKGFLCRPQEVAVNVEMHMRVVKGITRLITSNLGAEELLCVLWELCALSRTLCGRQALLTIGQFPEVVVVLIEALSSAKESELVALSSGTPLNLAIFHSAAEIFETLVTDPTSSSMGSWIDHAPELHRALHSSSPGSNRKDAPARLIEWIDAGVVYHKNGALGLLHYTAILASGGDAHITSANVLVSDSMDAENAEGDLSNSPSVNVVENYLGKLVSDKSFEGVALRDSSVAQLTTALRILAFISENPDIAAVLYDEGGVTVVYVVLLNCKLMLERSSNNYDYLVDEGTESNSTSDLLLERNREKCLVDLLIPMLLLLQELFKRLKEAKEQHRNTKLMNALLQLHRELSPKLTASAADLSSIYPEYALSLETVCHLITSALAYWPTLAWAPGLFHTLLDTVHVTSLLALGPKEGCSLFSLLNDLFPEEDIWLWKDGMPLFTALRSVAVGSILGPYKERQVNWYLDSVHVEQLVCQLAPQIHKIAQVLLRYAVSTLSVIQDMIRVFIIRIACQRAELASMLVRPIISWILDHMPESHSVADIDAYKIYKLLNLLSGLLEHPLAKPLLVKEGAARMLIKVLQWCTYTHGNKVPDVGSFTKSGFNLFHCHLPVLRSIALICDSRQAVQCPGSYDRQCHFTAEDSTMILRQLFLLCQSLPVEKEISACLGAFRKLASCDEGRSGLLEIYLHIKSNGVDDDQLVRPNEVHGTSSLSKGEWGKHPLLSCWLKLYRSVEMDGLSKYSVEALHALCLGALGFCIAGNSLNEDRVAALRYLFGLCHDVGVANSDQEHMKCIQYVQDMPTLLQSMVTGVEDMRTKTMLEQVLKASRFLLLLMQEQTAVRKVDASISEAVNLLTSKAPPPSNIQVFRDNSSRKSQSDLYFVESGEEFQWECPENLRNRLSQAGVPGKRKMPSSDGLSRHGRVDNPPSEAQSMFSRGSGLSAPPSGPTRRDTFRQRKPNTSRPPSMHVDDYVARERNADGTVNSNVIAIQRIGSSSGRPPSIHVDEFVARQRERQNTVAMAGSETVSQGKAAPQNDTKAEKPSNAKKLKVDLDDDLQGIDIVFDVEESEHDDKLPFPQPDDAAQQAASTTAEQSPQRSIVEETESDMNDVGTRVASYREENTQSGLSSRISVSQSATPLTREPSISSEKKYLEPGATAAPSNADLATSAQGLVNDSRMIPPAFYPRNNPLPTGKVPAVNVKPIGHHEPKFLSNQPPLPPTPPPPTISPLRSMVPDVVRGPSSPFINSMTDALPILTPAYHVQTEHQPAYNNIPTSMASSNPMVDMRYPRTAHSSPGGPSRPLPPLPSTPPPFPAAPFTIPLGNSNQSFGKQSGMGPSEVLQPPIASTDDVQLGSVMLSGSRHTYPSMPNATFSRPSPVLSTMHGSAPTQQQFDNLPNISPSNPAQSMQPIVQLQPLQAPQLSFPPQPPHQLRPTIQGLQQSDQSGLQAPGQVPTQSHTILQQSNVQQQYQLYHQQQRQENYSHAPHLQQMDHTQVRAARQQRDGVPQAQQDSAMTLQQYFSSPEAIQSLLSDRDKLCQLLEQHPKLMQMLQERLGQL